VKPEQGPEHLKFGGGVAETVLQPVVLLVILIAGALICFGPRRKAIVPFLSAALLIPIDQVILIGSLHFPMLRVIALFGIFRILKDKISLKSPIFSGGINRVDQAVIAFAVVTVVNAVLLFQQSAAAIGGIGDLYTIFGVYFLLRYLIQDQADILRALRTLAYIACFVALVMLSEVATGRNPYAWLGGAHAADYASLVLRDDRFRAQAGFAHSILAGTFGAVLVPLFVALWWKGREHRRIAVAGIIAATVIVLTSNSSTPVLAYVAGVLALAMWPLRDQMRIIRWGIVATLVALHLVMKAPVWNLIARIDIAGGSSGYHRYMLIDQCIRHFGDWWLVGVKDTSVWGWDMWDTANQYVGVCDGSGLLPFILFLAILVYGFKYLKKARLNAGSNRQAALFVWAIGAALFSHVVAFFGISYWDQTMVGWYALLAMISALHVTQKTKLLPSPVAVWAAEPLVQHEAADTPDSAEEVIARHWTERP
jgi:hypothetical protein